MTALTIDNLPGVAVAAPEQDGGTLVGLESSSLVGFYGATPVALRASSVQASSNLASSTAFGATQLAWAVEVTNTLVGLGLWKGSA